MKMAIATMLLLGACSPAQSVTQGFLPDKKPPRDSGDTGDTDDGGDTDDTDDTDDTEDSGDSATDTADSGEDTADTDDPGDTDGAFEGTVDCANLPAIGEVTEVAGARGYHDVIFTGDGRIMGSDNSSLVAADRDGNSEVFVPGLGMLEQFDYLPDGDLVVSEQARGRILRVSPDGAQTTLTSDVMAYGLRVGPDGKIYAANNRKVLRIDPDSGAQEELLSSRAIRGGARLLAFNQDATRLYVGVLSGNRIYKVDLDADLNPTGEPEVFATGVGSSYHDGMVLDVCGNVYLSVYSNMTVYRISPSGVVSTYYEARPNWYGHGHRWGTGQDGWREDAIYMPRPYGNNRVLEMIIGVPRAGWEGEVLNREG